MNWDVRTWPPKHELSWPAWLALLVAAPFVGAASGLCGINYHRAA
ncbi:MAG TPA: hypothetical protein VFG68_22940 [Fimbriiglobus sp.]|nr:hypothetical protein [Fimbriiglobus sp.]